MDQSSARASAILVEAGPCDDAGGLGRTVDVDDGDAELREDLDHAGIDPSRGSDPVAEVPAHLVPEEDADRVQLGFVERADVVELGVVLNAREVLVEVPPNRLAPHLLEDLFHDVDPELGHGHQRFDAHTEPLQLLDLVLEHLVFVGLSREVRDGEALGLRDQEFQQRRDVRVGPDVEQILRLSEVQDVHAFVHLGEDVAVRDAHDLGQARGAGRRIEREHDVVTVQALARCRKCPARGERQLGQAPLVVLQASDGRCGRVFEDRVHVGDEDRR